ncbi:hypothetical protein [Microcoleus sp. PH2017_05_CCC_O_A]|uniref:hypothetical protein n=1 Tax=Microcoleus sp. PH2017_05_CCC_O_A TaxID=2798816 RepID=UPI001D5D340B|nr:hypothetical protein [Microcoleus sp. PH2017_05_CCC_O_A]MCC3436650.1 hypothetical protein [Microcoleus sp. PH2017_05_CCC_O_A]
MLLAVVTFGFRRLRLSQRQSCRLVSRSHKISILCLVSRISTVISPADASGNCQGNKKPQPDVDRAAVVFKLNFQ